MKHVFIINPISGTGAYKDVEMWIHKTFRGREDSYEVRYTEYKGHAMEIAQEFKTDTILYSVGGDGTAHEVLNGMNFECELAIIPVGTGNDFWRMIESEKSSIISLLERLIEGKVRTIDVGSANGYYFLNSLNVGLDADVNRQVNRVRKSIFPRSFIYIYYAIAELLGKKAIPLHITIDDDETLDVMAILAACMNGKWYGGGFQSAPLAEIDDGLLDFVVIEDVKLRKIPRLFPKYFKGQHMDLDVVTYRQAKKILIETENSVTVGFDGEVHDFNRLEIQIHPEHLKLRVPVGNK